MDGVKICKVVDWFGVLGVMHLFCRQIAKKIVSFQMSVFLAVGIL